jgi:AP endonuclease-1
MSRRSSRKVNTVPSYAEVDEIPKQTATEKVEKRSPNRKAHRPIDEDQIGITTESVTSKAVKIKQTDKAVATVEAVTAVKVEKSPRKRKIKKEADASDGDIQKPIPLGSAESTKKAKAKRKAEAGEEAGQEPDSKKVKKKRKTREEKEAEAMPLAARTSIQSLKKAMYIGAHVSGAGGKYSHLIHYHVI